MREWVEGLTGWISLQKPKGVPWFPASFQLGKAEMDYERTLVAGIHYSTSLGISYGHWYPLMKGIATGRWVLQRGRRGLA